MTLPNDPPAPYNTQIPETETTIAEAQTLFKNNFERLFESFNTDHVSLIDSTNPGNHNVIQLVELLSPETTQSQEIAIYSKTVEGQTDQLFMRYQGNGKEFQITEYQIYEIPANSNQESYFTFLPGKIVVYFGRVFSSGKTSFNININPPIKINVSGVNLGGVGLLQVQPNVSLEYPVNGFFNNITLNTAAGSGGNLPMPDQFYLFFGNI